MSADKPRGARYWAKRWGVHHNTARRLLRHLRRHYGSTVVWQAGPQKALVATEASLQVAQVLRAERNVILVMSPAPSGAGSPTARVRRSDWDEDAQDAITPEQFSRAMQEVWAAIRQLQKSRR